MSSTLLTEEGEAEVRTAEELLKENRMKDLALSKASNLIELLNIELQVERNSSQQALRELQEQLKERYQRQLRQLQERIDMLQRELKRSNANQKNTPPSRSAVHSTVLTRANSAKSLQNKLKRSSVNKKYTETNPNEETDRFPIHSSVSNDYYRQQMLILEEWRSDMMGEFDSLVKSEYNDLERLINAIEGANEDFQAISASKHRQKRDLLSQMGEIIRGQNKVINSLRAYSQELEDLCKSTNYKLTSLLAKDEASPLLPLQEVEFKRMVDQMLGVIGMRKEELRVSFAGLEGENSELKNILDNMIRLVKEDKGMR